MKTEFDSITHQATYISKFMERNTDVKRECIVCGKPAMIQHNRLYPYRIRPLCRICRNKYKVNGHTVDSKPVPLPTIDLLEHINTKLKKYEDRDLTEEQISIINESIDNNWTKKKTCTELNLTSYGLNQMLKKYEETNPGIIDKFTKSSQIGRRNELLNMALTRKSASKFNSKIVQIKQERKLSTKDIVKLANNQISETTLNNIIEGKVNPNERFRKIISKTLEVDEEDLF